MANKANAYYKRVKATTKTQARYEGRAFHWGKAATCAHMLRYHARNMGRSLPAVPRFRSMRGAHKALEGMGFESLVELLDSLFERIPPARMVVGDIMALNGDAGFHALLIKGDRSKFLGWHESAPDCQFVDVENIGEAVGAWRL